MIGKQGLFNGLIGFRCCFMKELIASCDSVILKIIKNFWSSGLTAAGASRDSNKQSVRINPFMSVTHKNGLTILPFSNMLLVAIILPIQNNAKNL